MHPTLRLLQACRITLFTRANCSLCTDAKQVLSNVWDTRPFLYREIDVMKPEGSAWKNLYEFDTPVIHVSPAERGEEQAGLSGKASKLMHRFKTEDVHRLMDQFEDKSS